MPWNGTKVWTVGEKARSTDFNDYLSDNLDYLLSRVNGTITLASDISTTSTSYVDISGASVTLTIAGSQVLVIFDAIMTAWSNENIEDSFSIKIVKNGSDEKERTYPGKGSAGEGGLTPTTRVSVTIVHLITGLTPGLNTIKLQWKHNNGVGGTGGTVKLYGTWGAQFTVVEV